MTVAVRVEDWPESRIVTGAIARTGLPRAGFTVNKRVAVDTVAGVDALSVTTAQ